MERYSTFVAFLLILDALDKNPERDEYDIRLIEYDLDIAEDLYVTYRYQDEPVFTV